MALSVFFDFSLRESNHLLILDSLFHIVVVILTQQTNLTALAATKAK